MAAFEDWLEIYSSYSSAELATELTALKSQISVFESQTVKDSSFTRNLNELRSRLRAATRAKNAKGSSRFGAGREGQASFEDAEF